MDERFDLGKDIESLVEEVLETGHYASREEIFSAGVRLLHEREKKRADLEAALLEGIADADAGRVIDAEDVFRELDEKFAEMARRHSA